MYRTNRPPEEDGSGRLSSTDSSRPSSDILPLRDEGEGEDEDENVEKIENEDGEKEGDEEESEEERGISRRRLGGIKKVGVRSMCKE